MKILSHFTSFLNKADKQKNNPSFWQDKYIDFFENLPVPVIEIDNQKIKHFNKLSKLLFNITDQSGQVFIFDLFSEPVVPDKTETNVHFHLYSKNKKTGYIATILHRFTQENFIISLNINLQNIQEHNSADVYKGFFDKSLEGICLVDENGIIIEWNQAMSKIFEVPREKYLYKPIWELDYDFIPAERKNDEAKTMLQEVITEFINKRTNDVFIDDYEKEINGKIKYIHYRVFPIQTDNKRLYGRINLDVTKRKVTELELKKYQEHLEQLVYERSVELQKSEIRTQLLLKSLPLAYYSYHPAIPDERIWYSEYSENIGFINKNKSSADETPFWLSLVHPDDIDRLTEAISQIEIKGNLNIEYRWVNYDGKIKWVLDQAVQIYQEEVQEKLVIGCILDITEHKDAEKAIIENEKNYREIFNSNFDAIFIHNVETGKVEDVNNTMLRMYRCEFEDVFKHDIDGFSANNPPYDKENSLKHIKTAREKGVTSFEWLAQRKDGTRFWAEVNLKLIRLNGVEKIMAVVRDIDEKKNTDIKIKYHDDLEKLIFSISSAFFDLPPAEIEKGISNELGKICAFLNSDLAYLYFFNNLKLHTRVSYFWHNDKIQIRREIFFNKDYNVLQWHTQRILKNQVIKVESINSLSDDADTFKKFINIQGVNSFLSIPLNYQGKVIGFIGLASNVDNREWQDEEISLLLTIGQTFINNIIRKDSLEALRESEQEHREIFNSTTEAIIVHDVETGMFLDVNQAMLDMFQLSYEEALSMDPSLLTFPTGAYTSANGYQQIIKTLNEGPQVFEWLTKRKDGTEFWVEISLRSTEIKGVSRVISVVRDITERKNTEEIIRKNEEKYRLLIEGQTDLVVKLNKEKNLLFVSPSYCELFNKSELELLNTEFISPIHPQDKSLTIAILGLLIEAPHTCYLEHRAFTRHGWRWLSWNTKAVLDENKQLTEIIGVGRDITYQKGVEEALRKSEDRFRSIIQQLSDIVFIIDRNAAIIFDTPSVKNILGYNEGDLIGKLALDLVHPDDLPSTSEKLNELINNLSSFVAHEMRIINADNQWVSIEAVGINMLNHPSINGLVITCRDIRERKHIENRILDAIIKTEEHERERFAKNLHDDLGPLLSSIKMYINSFSTTKDVKKQEYIINQLNEIVKEAIVTTKGVSNDLSPHILINYGLVAAIDSFLNKVPATIKVNFENKLISERLSIHIENSTYRIIKELINNSLKHSQANNIIIRLIEHNNFLNLFYSDNGIGFDLSEMNKSKGMGFSNIISRAKALNSIYEFQTEPDKGFTFKIKIPIHQTQE